MFFDNNQAILLKVEAWIRDYCQSSSSGLDDACFYSVMGDGKRLRPLLIVGVSQSLSVPISFVRKLAISVELLHTATLIHDDLPSLDNDSTRRGQPTAHVIYGEGNAILAGDELISRAFSLLAEDATIVDKQRLLLIALLARIYSCVNYGQFLDLSLVIDSRLISCEKMSNLLNCYVTKTAYLLAYSIAAPVLLSGEIEKGDYSIYRDLFLFGVLTGLMFQIADDFLDSNRDKDNQEMKNGDNLDDRVVLGPQLQKTTLLSTLGEERTQFLAINCYSLASNLLDPLQDRFCVDFLRDFLLWVSRQSLPTLFFR